MCFFLFFFSEKEYCKSTQCVQAASSILAAMDSEAEPCTDFFQYACGKWVRQNPIPKGYHKWDRVQELSGQNLYVLKSIIGRCTCTRLSVSVLPACLSVPACLTVCLSFCLSACLSVCAFGVNFLRPQESQW